MAFEEIARSSNRGAVAAPSTGVSMGVYRNKTAAMGDVIFRIMPDALTRLGWKTGDNIAVREGTGTDSGFLLLVRVPSNGYRLRPVTTNTQNDGHMFAVRSSKFKHYRTTTNEYTPPAPVEYQVFRSDLTIMVPSWLAYAGT